MSKYSDTNIDHTLFIKEKPNVVLVNFSVKIIQLASKGVRSGQYNYAVHLESLDVTGPPHAKTAPLLPKWINWRQRLTGVVPKGIQ